MPYLSLLGLVPVLPGLVRRLPVLSCLVLLSVLSIQSVQSVWQSGSVMTDFKSVAWGCGGGGELQEKMSYQSGVWSVNIHVHLS